MNKLQFEKSPYLLQHKNNPVDWLPWGNEAFEKAKKNNQLLFISIGYSTCHWCHVMERESFRDFEIAKLLNEHFVPVKVDREERPDIDSFFINAIHKLNQQGGWPLNMFVTPEGQVLQGGTYFPPEDLPERPSFKTVLRRISGLWKTEEQKLRMAATAIEKQINDKSEIFPSKIPRFDWDSENNTLDFCKKTFDKENGGFKYQPDNKFPPHMLLSLLLLNFKRTGDQDSLKMVKETVDKMFHRGIYDQVGGGIFRYSTDYEWKLPHFEKMLYDNALFSKVLIQLFQVTSDQKYQEMAKHVFTYVTRDLLSKEGAFYSAEDADSEGEEGKFYLWNYEELKTILSEDEFSLAKQIWEITEAGNAEGEKISLFQTAPEIEGKRKEAILDKLFKIRSKLKKPFKDDKIITSWNALMVQSFAMAARAFNKSGYLNIALDALTFLEEKLVTNDKVMRRYRDNDSAIAGTLADYAEIGLSYLEVFKVNQDLSLLLKARDIALKIQLYFKNEDGPFYDNSRESDPLLRQHFEGFDGVEPSGNSSAALLFLLLDGFGFDNGFRKDAERILSSFRKYLLESGVSFSVMLSAKHLLIEGFQQVVIFTDGEADKEIREVSKYINSNFHPNTLMLKINRTAIDKYAKELPFLKDLSTKEGTEIFMCKNSTCNLPVKTFSDFLKVINS